MTDYDADMISVGILCAMLIVNTVLTAVNATRNGR